MVGGAEIWRGRSRIDGAPIVAIATDGSRNRKTGPMIQTWILRADMAPTDAVRLGADASICGRCPFGPGRPHGSFRACYVPVGRVPLLVWRRWAAGGYPLATERADRVRLGRGRPVRLGSYGDPAAVPPAVWHDLTRRAAVHTGYTHQWRDGFALQDLCMASVETDADAADARAAGWRVFQVTDGPRRRRGAIMCRNAENARWTCSACAACSGGRGPDVTQPIHGPARYRGLTVVTGGV
jgi:hypothetical protein